MVRYLFYAIGDLTYQSPLVHTRAAKVESSMGPEQRPRRHYGD